MKVVITGATGFLGVPLVKHLQARGDDVVALVRDPARVGDKLGAAKLVRADLEVPGAWADELDGAGAVVHLAGEPIAGKRWDARQKQVLRDSRIEATRNLVDAIGNASRKPSVLASASGIDYYAYAPDKDDFDDDAVTESDPPGEEFLARLCKGWEAEALAASKYGIRVCTMRTGIVLANHGGALERMQTPFKLFVGGKLGNGRQFMSWIHRDDVVAAYATALTDERYVGPVNLVAGSVRNADFAQTLGHVMHRPALLPVPAFALRLAVGELAESIVHGRNVVPARLRELGFPFAHPELAEALAVSVRQQS